MFGIVFKYMSPNSPYEISIVANLLTGSTQILANVEKRLKKMFRPAFGCAQHLKAGRNTQQMVPYYLIKNNT